MHHQSTIKIVVWEIVSNTSNQFLSAHVDGIHTAFLFWINRTEPQRGQTRLDVLKSHINTSDGLWIFYLSRAHKYSFVDQWWKVQGNAWCIWSNICNISINVNLTPNN